MENERSRGWLDLLAASAPRLQLLARSISRETGSLFQTDPQEPTRPLRTMHSPHTRPQHTTNRSDIVGILLLRYTLKARRGKDVHTVDG